jgi:hypothetical protein
MQFIVIGIIILFVLKYTNRIDTNKFIQETKPYFNILLEPDYKFLASIKYKVNDEEASQLFDKRVMNAAITIIFSIFAFLSNLTFISIIIAFIIGFVIFKSPYWSLRTYYRNNLQQINTLLPYYLKTLEILIQNYTIPVALAKSINSAPELFKPGLTEMIERINMGDSTVDPYMDFAKKYPVRDSMRMMRLLYRLGLGSQENKQEQLLLFSRSVSALQSKARDLKYKERLERMEGQTMKMLIVTGGGVLILLLFMMALNFQL